MSAQPVERTIDGLHEWLLARVLELAGISRASRVLDLGCGSGAWLTRLHQAGFRALEGVDNEGNGFCAHGLAGFAQADLGAPELGLGDRKFDLITAIEVIEHLANPGLVLAHARRYLAPEGWLVVTSPNIYALGARIRFLLNGELRWFDAAAPDHLHPVLLETFLPDALRRTGLKLQRAMTYPEGHGLHSRSIPALLTRILSALIPDDLPGDALCLLIQRA